MTTGTDIVEPQGTAYAPTELRRFAAALFREAGLELDKPDVVAEGLLESDLLGHTTHGLALAPRYLKEIASGSMATQGEPEIISRQGRLRLLERSAPPRGVARDKGHRPGGRARRDTRDRHRGRRQQPPHRVSRCLSPACDGEGLHGHRVGLRPIAKVRRPVWGQGSRVHAQSDRGWHPHRGRPCAAGYKRVDQHQ